MMKAGLLLVAIGTVLNGLTLLFHMRMHLLQEMHLDRKRFLERLLDRRRPGS